MLDWVKFHAGQIPRSSNGRTAAFGAVNRGSNPCRGAKHLKIKNLKEPPARLNSCARSPKAHQGSRGLPEKSLVQKHLFCRREPRRWDSEDLYRIPLVETTRGSESLTSSSSCATTPCASGITRFADRGTFMGTRTAACPTIRGHSPRMSLSRTIASKNDKLMA